ncbi:MAG: single-stranded DNA-binding protein [Clostridia bacterium]|nr:single-stranded DNA-binding protein [Clostridia bacterium]MBQ8399376.1 single-stranded DNA-binding protein [Clostridia bacterium]
MANFNFNKVILGGRLTAEPELKQTTNGTPVLSFSVAVNRKIAKGAEQKTDFINCRAWRTTAEFISRYFHKGSCISIVGQLQQNSWTDQQGAKRTTYEVLVDEVAFVDSASENRGSQSAGYNPYASEQSGFSSPAEDASRFEQVENEDDLPF